MQDSPLDPEVRAEIQRIALEAISLGWTPELLWEARFWNIVPGAGNRPGLAAVMRPGDKITEVTEDYIAITKASGIVQRFYHPDRPPWKRKEVHYEQSGFNNP